MNQAFWAHVDWTADTDVFEACGGFHSEAEVSKFVFSALNENIGKFDISVYYA